MTYYDPVAMVSYGLVPIGIELLDYLIMLSELEEEMRDILHTWLKLPCEDQKWIPLEEMKIGNYLCSARNFDVGYWNGNEFEYERTKFGSTFPDTEEHWDRGSPYGTSKPLKYLGDSEQ